MNSSKPCHGHQQWMLLEKLHEYCFSVQHCLTQTHSSWGVILESQSLHTSPSMRAARFLKSAL